MIRSLALVAALVGCTFTPAPVPPEPDSNPTPVSEDAGAGDCSAACANLARLGCDGGDDPDCVAMCDNVERLHASGESELTFHPECLARASTCDESEACGA